MGSHYTAYPSVERMFDDEASEILSELYTEHNIDARVYNIDITAYLQEDEYDEDEYDEDEREDIPTGYTYECIAYVKAEDGTKFKIASQAIESWESFHGYMETYFEGDDAEKAYQSYLKAKGGSVDIDSSIVTC